MNKKIHKAAIEVYDQKKFNNFDKITEFQSQNNHQEQSHYYKSLRFSHFYSSLKSAYLVRFGGFGPKN